MLFEIIISVSYTFICFMAMTGTGLFILRRVRLEFGGYFQTILFAIGIGFALITNILFFIGLAGMLSKLIAFVVLFIFCGIMD